MSESVDILTSAELDVIEQRVNKATEAPWIVHGVDSRAACVVHQHIGLRGTISRVHIAAVDGRPSVSEPDAEFIAHSRTDMSRLIATVRALQTGVVDEREACAKIADEWQNSDADMSEKLAARIIADLIRQRGEQ